MLLPYEYNPRTHESELEYLKNSIKEFGFRNPILIDKNHVIIAGHGRRIAAIELGLDRVPCIVCSDLTDSQVKALRNIDNKVADLSGWDFDMLNKELAELKDLGWDMENFGFEDMSKYDDLDVDGESEILEDMVLDGGSAETTAEYKLMVRFGDPNSQEELYQRLLGEGYLVQKLN